jgi:hypothetical protein
VTPHAPRPRAQAHSALQAIELPCLWVVLAEHVQSRDRAGRARLPGQLARPAPPCARVRVRDAQAVPSDARPSLAQRSEVICVYASSSGPKRRHLFLQRSLRTDIRVLPGRHRAGPATLGAVEEPRLWSAALALAYGLWPHGLDLGYAACRRLNPGLAVRRPLLPGRQQARVRRYIWALQPSMVERSSVGASAGSSAGSTAVARAVPPSGPAAAARPDQEHRD